MPEIEQDQRNGSKWTDVRRDVAPASASVTQNSSPDEVSGWVSEEELARGDVDSVAAEGDGGICSMPPVSRAGCAGGYARLWLCCAYQAPDPEMEKQFLKGQVDALQAEMSASALPIWKPGIPKNDSFGNQNP